MKKIPFRVCANRHYRGAAISPPSRLAISRRIATSRDGCLVIP